MLFSECFLHSSALSKSRVAWNSMSCDGSHSAIWTARLPETLRGLQIPLPYSFSSWHWIKGPLQGTFEEQTLGHAAQPFLSPSLSALAYSMWSDQHGVQPSPHRQILLLYFRRLVLVGKLAVFSGAMWINMRGDEQNTHFREVIMILWCRCEHGEPTTRDAIEIKWNERGGKAAV